MNVILLRVHCLNEDILAQYRAMRESCSSQYDVILLCDNTSGQIKIPEDCQCHILNIEDIRHMGYPMWENRGLWFHMDYAVLHFFQDHSQYEYYWIIEYDVRFEGKWKEFFDAFENNKADVLATYVRSYKDDPQWRWWGDHNLKIEREQWKAIFCPVTRLSNAALKLLDKSHKQGLYGYCEVLIPTLAQQAGLTVEDIGEQFYDPLASFNFNGVVSRQKGKLVHPVKDIDSFNRGVSLYRYIFKAKYDSHWSIQAAQYMMFNVLRIRRRVY